MADVLDRTRHVTHRKGAAPCRYEVVIFHTEDDWEKETGSVVAKFAHCGDAFLWAKAIREPVFGIVVRN